MEVALQVGDVDFIGVVGNFKNRRENRTTGCVHSFSFREESKILAV